MQNHLVVWTPLQHKSFVYIWNTCYLYMHLLHLYRLLYFIVICILKYVLRPESVVRGGIAILFHNSYYIPFLTKLCITFSKMQNDSARLSKILENRIVANMWWIWIWGNKKILEVNPVRWTFSNKIPSPFLSMFVSSSCHIII